MNEKNAKKENNQRNEMFEKKRNINKQTMNLKFTEKLLIDLTEKNDNKNAESEEGEKWFFSVANINHDKCFSKCKCMWKQGDATVSHNKIYIIFFLFYFKPSNQLFA